MLKQAAIVLAAIAITACGEDNTVATTPAVETAPVEMAATPAVETTEVAPVEEVTEATESVETATEEAAPATEAVATGDLEG